MNSVHSKLTCVTLSHTIEGRSQVTFWRWTNLLIGIHFSHLFWWPWWPRRGFCAVLDISFLKCSQKGSSNTERGKLDWMGKKPWITCICRLASCARGWMLTIIKINLKLHWFAVRQLFTKRWKDNANTYDTQQFISVRLRRRNTWYSDIFKIQKVKPFNQQTMVL